MKNLDKNKIEEWSGNVARARSERRREYAANPAYNKWFLKVYEKEILGIKNKFKNPRILILGATPETRNLVLGNGLDLTLIDQNREMIKKMGEFVVKNKSKEKVVVGNWLKMPFEADCFDMVLGDGVSNNIQYKDQLKFFREIRRVLKDNGVMLLREACLGENTPKWKVKDILNQYRKNKDFPSLFLKFNFFSELSEYNKIKKYFNMARMFSRLPSVKKMFKGEEYEKLMGWRGTIKHSIFKANDLKELIKKIFGNSSLIKSKNNKNIILKTFGFFKAVKYENKF